MTEVQKMSFDPVRFLATEGPGRSILHNTAREVFFSQGASSRLCVLSPERPGKAHCRL